MKKQTLIIDDQTPETIAMMSALYSRSDRSVTEHLSEVQKRGSDAFMRSYYVGYGHPSIADTAFTTAYIEQVSMLTAKAVQNNPLYNGQESSTRYIDFSSQVLGVPVDDPELHAMQERWRAFYTRSLEPLRAHLRTEFPDVDQEGAKWEKTITARSFDILRSVLPAGATTQLSWTTNLRQAHDNLVRLRHHPLAEIRDTANELHGRMSEQYEASFSHRENVDRDEYLNKHAEEIHYQNDPRLNAYFSRAVSKGVFLVRGKPDIERLTGEHHGLIYERPRYTDLPVVTAGCGTYNFVYALDFGGYRDIQRHRGGWINMPLLTTEVGFEQWYLDQMPTDMAAELEVLLTEQRAALALNSKRLELTPVQQQYLIPMGYRVVVDCQYSLKQVIYVTELRSGRTVHPTLRKVIRKMYTALETDFPDIPLYVDRTESDWDTRRGTQDITRVVE